MSTVRSALSAQGKKIHFNETQLNTIGSDMKELTERQAELQSTVVTQVNHLTAQLQLIIARLEDLTSPKPASPVPDQATTSLAPPPASPRPVRPSRTGEIFGRFWSSESSLTEVPGPTSDDHTDPSKVPRCYHDLREAFNKVKATSLPPHRHWDCAIDLLSGAPIPRPGCMPSLDMRGRPWSNTSKHHSSLASSAPLHRRPERGPLSARRMAHSGRVSITVLSLPRHLAPVLTMPEPKMQFVVEVDAAKLRRQEPGAVGGHPSPRMWLKTSHLVLSFARSKASRQARMGLLQPLLVPHRPWSHITLDFVMGLPPSQASSSPNNEKEMTVPSAHALLKLPRSLRVHPTFHVSKLKPVRKSPLVLLSKPPPPLKMVDGRPVYMVKKLLAVRGAGGGSSWSTG
ncbi:hypothetical protein L3Q82_024027, partial [Scortum barcoo]